MDYMMQPFYTTAYIAIMSVDYFVYFAKEQYKIRFVKIFPVDF